MQSATSSNTKKFALVEVKGITLEGITNFSDDTIKILNEAIPETLGNQTFLELYTQEMRRNHMGRIWNETPSKQCCILELSSAKEILKIHPIVDDFHEEIIKAASYRKDTKMTCFNTIIEAQLDNWWKTFKTYRALAFKGFSKSETLSKESKDEFIPILLTNKKDTQFKQLFIAILIPQLVSWEKFKAVDAHICEMIARTLSRALDPRNHPDNTDSDNSPITHELMLKFNGVTESLEKIETRSPNPMFESRDPKHFAEITVELSSYTPGLRVHSQDIYKIYPALIDKFGFKEFIVSRSHKRKNPSAESTNDLEEKNALEAYKKHCQEGFKNPLNPKILAQEAKVTFAMCLFGKKLKESTNQGLKKFIESDSHRLHPLTKGILKFV